MKWVPGLKIEPWGNRQQTLCVPAPWLKQGPNEVIVSDREGGPEKEIKANSTPTPNGPTHSH